MSVLFVTSLNANSGKTMVCAGLGKYWLDHNLPVGYLKLVPGEASAADREIEFLPKILNLISPPAVFNEKDRDSILRQIPAGTSQDIYLIEALLNDVTVDLVRQMQAKVLVIHDYSVRLSETLNEYRKLDASLAGILINKVPRNKLALLQNQFAAELNTAQIPLLGIIPEDRLLMAPSVADLSGIVQGKNMIAAANMEELIENLMMGSSTFDRGAVYYNRKANKAVILWGERPGYRKAALAGLQQAAMQTSTRCIVISANGVPIPAVAQKAEELQTQIISAPGTLPALIAMVDQAMGQIRFTQEKKLPHLMEVLSPKFNFNRLSQTVGIGLKA